MSITRRKFLGGAAGCAIGCLGPAVQAATGDPAEEVQVLCGYNGYMAHRNLLRVRDPDPEALRVVNWITDAVGIHPNFHVMEGVFSRSPIAYANIERGRRVIVYDGDRFHWGNERVYWREVAIMAHEVGHHLGAHVYVREQSAHERELEADRFAGVVLARLGSTLEQAVRVTEALNKEGTSSHPPRRQRSAAMDAGWHHGRAMMAREGAQCRDEWLSEELNIGDRVCRPVRRCDGGAESVRLACLGHDGLWRWTR